MAELTDPSTLTPRERPRRRRVRALLLSLLGLLALLFLGALLLRDRLALWALPRLLGPALGMTVRVEGVATSLSGEIEIRGLSGADPADWAPVRALTIERLRIRAPIGRLLREGLAGIESVALSGGTIEIDGSRSPPPAPAPLDGRAETGQGFTWPERFPSLDLKLDRVSVLSGESQATLRRLEVLSVAAAGGSAVTLRGELDWSAGDRSGTEAIDLSLQYQRGVVSELALALGGRRLLQSGRFDCARLEGETELRMEPGGGKISIAGLAEGRAEFAVALSDLPVDDLLPDDLLARALPGAIPTGGKLSLQGEVILPLEAPLDGTARLRFSWSDGRNGDFSLSCLEGQFLLSSQTLEVERFAASGPGVELLAESLGVSLAILSPEEIVSSLSGKLSLSVPDLSRLASFLTDDRRLLLLSRDASFDGRFRIQGTGCAVESLDLAAPLFTLALNGARGDFRWDSPLESTVALRGRLTLPNLSRFEPVLGEAVPTAAGRLEISFAAEGPLEGISGRIDLAGESLAVAGISLGSLEGTLAGDRSAIQILSFNLGSGSPSPLHLALQGEFRIPTGLLDDVTLEARGSGLRRRAPAGSALDRWLPEGPFQLTASARGPIDWPDVHLELQAEGAGAPESPLNLAAAVRKEGDQAELSLEASAPGGLRLSLGISGTVARNLSQGDLAVERLSLAQGGDRWEVKGRPRIAFRLDRRSLAIDPPLVLAGERGSVLLGVTAEPGAGSESLLAARMEANFPGPFPWPRLLDGLDLNGLDVELDARGAIPSIASARVPSTRVPSTLALMLRAHAKEVVTPESWAGGSFGEADLCLEIDQAEGRPQGTLTCRIPRVTLLALPGQAPLREPLSGRLELSAGWDGSVARIERLEGELAGVRLSGDGAAWVELDRLERERLGLAAATEPPHPVILDVHLRAEAPDISAARRLSQILTRVQGGLTLDARLEGPWSDPAVDASLAARGVEVKCVDLPALSSVEGRATFHDGAVVVESVSGEMGGAPIQLTGRIESILRAPAVDLSLNGTNTLLFRSDRARLRADTALRVSGEPSGLLLSGSIRISDARVLEEVPLVEILGTLTRRVAGLATRGFEPAAKGSPEVKGGGLRLFSLRQAILKDVRLEVKVTSGQPVEIRGNVFQGKIRPEVTLIGTGEVPRLSGSVYLDDFALFLPATRIRVESGSIRFDEKNSLVPEINLAGSARIQGYDITVKATGPLNEFTVVFSSNPPIPSDQLAVLVMTGRGPSTEGAESDKKALFTLVQYFGSDLLRQLFARADVDRAESFLDRFDFEAGRNLSRSGADTWEARFRLKEGPFGKTDTLYLTGEQDEFDHYNVGLRIVFRGR